LTILTKDEWATWFNSEATKEFISILKKNKDELSRDEFSPDSSFMLSKDYFLNLGARREIQICLDFVEKKGGEDSD